MLRGVIKDQKYDKIKFLSEPGAHGGYKGPKKLKNLIFRKYRGNKIHKEQTRVLRIF